MRRSRFLDGTLLTARTSQGRSLVKSIQRGTTTLIAQTSNTSTITAVDPNNSAIHFLGSTFNASSVNEAVSKARVTLTNATTVTVTQNTANANTTTVSWEVIEYWPGVIKSVQRGTIIVTTTATITTVDTTKAIVDFLGFSSTVVSFDAQDQPNVVLTNATTVTGTATAAGATVGFQIVEFY